MNFEGSGFVLTARQPDVMECQHEKWPCPFLGNGKRAIMPSWRADRCDATEHAVMAIERPRMSTDSMENASDGHRANALSHTYRTGDVRFGNPRPRDLLCERRGARLDLSLASFSTEHDIADKSSGRNVCSVTVESFVPRQYPFCTVHRFALRTSAKTVDAFHAVHFPESVANHSPNPPPRTHKISGVDVLTASCIDRSDLTIKATACCYLWDDAPSAETVGLLDASIAGEQDDDDSGTSTTIAALNGLRFHVRPREEEDADESSSSDGTPAAEIHTVKFSILTSCLHAPLNATTGTEHGLETCRWACVEMLLGIVAKDSPTPWAPRSLLGTAIAISLADTPERTDPDESQVLDTRECAEVLFREHIEEWARLWSVTDIMLVETPGGDTISDISGDISGSDDDTGQDDRSSVEKAQGRLRYCTYVILSHVRADSDLGDPSRLFAGRSSFDRFDRFDRLDRFQDAFARLHWLLPTLTLMELRQIAEGMLDREHAGFASAVRNMRRAITSANGEVPTRFGSFESFGSFASSCTSHEGASLPELDYESFPGVLACELCKAAWNHFRATGDREWLAGKGISIIGSTADFVASRELQGFVETTPELELLTTAKTELLCSGADIDASAYIATKKEVHDARSPRIFASVAKLAALRCAREAMRVLAFDFSARLDHWDRATQSVSSSLAMWLPDHPVWQEVEGENTAVLPPEINFERGDLVTIAEPLALLVPDFFAGGFDSSALASLTGRRLDDLQEPHLRFYARSAKLRENGFEHPYTLAWIAMLHGSIMHRQAKSAREAWAAIDTLPSSMIVDDGVWENLAIERRRDSSRNSTLPSPPACALYINVFLKTICGFRLSGALTPDGYAFERFGVNAVKEGSTVLPAELRRVYVFRPCAPPSRSSVSPRQPGPLTLVNNGKSGSPD